LKKIINQPQNVVEEMVAGMAKANPELLKKIEGFNILVRKEQKENKVALVSGGGSGHEPSHAGYVGSGMLDAAVAGPVFTSPNPSAVYRAIQEVSNPSGVLLIIKNYSGDVMNFKMAAEKAEKEGINCEYVVVNDDVAIKDSEDRRGIAGTVLVHKIAGAAAEQGKDLSAVKAVAEKAISAVNSKGVALSPCYSPSSGQPSFEVGPEEMEVGLGIHGEPGVEVQDLKTSREITEMLLEDILAEFKNDEQKFAVMINSLGATPLMELNILANDTYDYLKDQNCKLYKFYTGHYMTSMEMQGISLTLLAVDKEIEEFLSYPSDTLVKL